MITSANMNLELLEDTDNFGTNKIKSNFEKIDEKAIIPEKLVNNCVTDNPNLALAASQGKVLKGEIDALNGDLDVSSIVRFREIRNTDIDTVQNTGLYGVQANCTNIPSSERPFGFMVVIEYRRSAANHIAQIFVSINASQAGTDLGDLFFRFFNAYLNTWTDWKKVTSAI
ncbi:MAG: hypothetical protein HFE83_11925 [Lachnospiraceae bacterium]|nr:hypothetical protein [Lachnospiraceae bacterium]